MISWSSLMPHCDRRTSPNAIQTVRSKPVVIASDQKPSNPGWPASSPSMARSRPGAFLAAQ